MYILISAFFCKHVLILFLIDVTVGGQVQHAFQHHPEFVNKICPPENIITTLTLQSRLECAVICKRTGTCRKFMFNGSTKVCVICRGMYFGAQDLPTASGYRHYNDITRNYHLSCTTSSDCREGNNTCENLLKLCVCTPGYSFHPATSTCIAGCETYGDTFETYKQMHMAGYNDGYRSGVTLDWSKNFCVNAAFLCLSLEMEGSSAWFSTANPLTHPSGWQSYSGEDSYYYNRNCYDSSTCPHHIPMVSNRMEIRCGSLHVGESAELIITCSHEIGSL